jgi:hypothetical protein
MLDRIEKAKADWRLSCTALSVVTGFAAGALVVSSELAALLVSSVLDGWLWTVLTSDGECFAFLACLRRIALRLTSRDGGDFFLSRVAGCIVCAAFRPTLMDSAVAG